MENLPKGYTWRQCPVCKQRFAAKRRDAVTCSSKCRWQRLNGYRYRVGRPYDHTWKLPWYRANKLSEERDS